MKSFIVIGIGQFGSSLAKSLYKAGHEVIAIDMDEVRINDIADEVTHAMVADMTDERVVKSIGVQNFDAVIISIGANIRGSVLSTVLCKEQGAKYVIAKASDDLHAKLLLKTGADKVIQPEKEAGIRLARSLVSDNIIDYLDLSDQYSIHEIHIPSPWINKTLVELDVRKKYDVSVIAIRRGDDILVTLNPQEPLQEKDVLILIGSNKGFDKISSLRV